MPSGLNTTEESVSPARLWQTVAHRFTEQRDCLVSFLAFESAEVLAGVKPGNLINIVNRNKPCGRNLYQLWNRFGRDIMAQAPLDMEILADRGHSLLVYVYRRELLAMTLGAPQAQNFMARAGYPSETRPEKMIAELKLRIKQEEFPHEIGIFLGYPLKDIEGFLGWHGHPFTCQGPWKIYGDPRPSLQLAKRHRLCRERMIHRLARTDDPIRCMVASPERTWQHAAERKRSAA